MDLNKDKSATATNTGWREENMIDQDMQRRLEYFYECWMPEGKDASRFAADLHMLVRSIYAEASEPANKQLMQLMKCIPIVIPGIKS